MKKVCLYTYTYLLHAVVISHRWSSWTCF
jgi:hypothetical protein